MSTGSTELYHHLQRLRTAYQALRDAAWRHFDRHHALPAEFESVTHYLHLLVDNIAQGLLFIDAEGRILTYNKQAEHMLKIPAEQVLHKTFWNVFADDLFGFSIKLALKEKLTFENKSLQLNNNTVLSADFHPIAAEPIQGGVLLIQDMTELHHWQQLADRRDRLQELGEMVGMVAHEIRNPLGGIQGYANLLERELAQQPEQQKLAKAIATGTADLNQLVSTILNYAHPLDPHFETVDVEQLTNQLKQEMQDLPQLDPGIELRFACPKGLTAKLDPHLMKSALRNLLVNAIQAMPNGGTLSLQAKENEFIIKDEGIGIAPENLEKLYSPLFTTREEGNGFGLAEVYKIIQSHQGEIECDSTVGLGTTFRIRLWIKS